jgi:NDP-sugar pyrophosphorylase family protein
MTGDRIIEYEERPSKPKTYLTSTFIGVYDPAVFEYIPKGNMKWVLQTDLFPRLISESRLFGCMVPGTYVNIHSRSDLGKISNTRVLRSNK